MIRRLSVLLVALLALGFVVAGCGEDEDESKNDSDKPAQQAPAETDGAEADEPSTETESDDSAGAGTPPSDEAIKQCKAQVDANPQLSEEAKSKIGEVCENTAQNDPEAAAEATKETCRIVVEESAPAGPARDAALQACDQAAPPAP